MATDLLTIEPQRDGYSFTPARDFISIALDGGQSRMRRDKINASQQINATWILRLGQYNYLMGFFREATFNGTVPFRVPLLSDAGIVLPHICLCPDGIPRLVQQSGDAYFVQGVLEVFPNPIRSYGLALQSAGTPVVIDHGIGVFQGDINEFPVGRDVVLTNTHGFINTTVAIHLDGTYEIDSIISDQVLELVNPAAVNAQWTTLAAGPQTGYTPTDRQGAMILLPE